MKVVILNTGSSNLLSVQHSVERLGYSVEISDDMHKISCAEKIIFPGIGTISAVMDRLYFMNLVNIIREITQPLLGICLGMQVLGLHSEESGGVKSLGIVPDIVSLIDSKGLVLPHVGWNSIDIISENPLFKNITIKDRFYFLHSYAMPINKYTISSTLYGVNFSSSIQYNNFFGVQFHPEKSGLSGQTVLKNFLKI
ncbi:MAG: imidazole glycerol phosphate synthase subunit HisH [Buchnera aphidicola (Eriosoma harunire)]